MLTNEHEGEWVLLVKYADGGWRKLDILFPNQDDAQSAADRVHAKFPEIEFQVRPASDAR